MRMVGDSAGSWFGIVVDGLSVFAAEAIDDVAVRARLLSSRTSIF